MKVQLALSARFILPETLYEDVYAVFEMCRVLEVTEAGYYAWKRHFASTHTKRGLKLKGKIFRAWESIRPTYGSLRVLKELSHQGERTSKKRIARLMAELKIQGASRSAAKTSA
mgnify:CR=1 FL=1